MEEQLSYLEIEVINLLKKNGTIKSFPGDTGPYRKGVVMLLEKGIIERTYMNSRASSKIHEYRLKVELSNKRHRR